MEDNFKKIIRESLITEIGSQDILDRFGSQLSDLLDDATTYYLRGSDKHTAGSVDMAVGLLKMALDKVAGEKGYGGTDPSKYRSN